MEFSGEKALAWWIILYTSLICYYPLLQWALAMPDHLRIHYIPHWSTDFTNAFLVTTFFSTRDSLEMTRNLHVDVSSEYHILWWSKNICFKVALMVKRMCRANWSVFAEQQIPPSSMGISQGCQTVLLKHFHVAALQMRLYRPGLVLKAWCFEWPSPFWAKWCSKSSQAKVNQNDAAYKWSLRSPSYSCFKW